MTVTEHPVFVPCDGGHVAAVITLPDGPARGLALLIQGGATPRSHRNRTWTTVARDLAVRGVASVRLDHGKTGDSTPQGPRPRGSLPIARASAVAEVAMAAAGTRRLAIVGNCLGARTGFAMAAADYPGSKVVCIILDQPRGGFLVGDVPRTEGAEGDGTVSSAAGSSRRVRAGRGARRRPLGRRLRSRARKVVARMPRVRRRLRQWRRTANDRVMPVPRFIPEIEAAVAGGSDALFLFVGRQFAVPRFRRSVGKLPTRTPESGKATIRPMPMDRATGMRIPLAEQPALVDAIVEWLVPAFERGEPTAAAQAVSSLDAAERTGPREVHAA